MKLCYACGLNNTPRYLNHDKENNFLCKSCHNKYNLTPGYHIKFREKWGKYFQLRRIQFKGNRIYVKDLPRSGICAKCGAVQGKDIKRTNLHHIEYHEENPLKDVIELCVSCHRREHKK